MVALQVLPVYDVSYPDCSCELGSGEGGGGGDDTEMGCGDLSLGSEEQRVGGCRDATARERTSNLPREVGSYVACIEAILT